MTTNATVDSAITDKWATRIHEYFAIADRWEVDSFGRYLSADLKFQFGNIEPIVGLATMIGFAQQQQPLVKSVSHRLGQIVADVDRRTVIVELEVTYVRHDDAVKKYPAAVALEFDSAELISAYRVYVDLSGLL
jgi:hypothetical protein